MSSRTKTRNEKRLLSRRGRFYCWIAIFTFLIGLGPTFFNLVVDPYEMNGFFDLGLKKMKISEKSHYPLWKVVHYPEETSDVVILGDSRSRALKDKYWHELGLSDAYNFAYGGATVYEIYDTFHFVKKNSPNLKSLIVGIQLRSFDPDHKGGMNRVPEAIRLHDNPLQYYSNWFVSGIGIDIIDQQYDLNLKQLANLEFGLFSSAQAEEQSRAVSGDPMTELSDLLKPVVCKNCLLPQKASKDAHPTAALKTDYYFANDLGLWRGLWKPTPIDRTLSGVFERQVRKNARSDWNSFDFSEELWAYLVEIAAWCRQNNIKLIFVIPPTIIEMQQRIVEFGYGALNHEFRQRLSRLGMVVDFDFDNHLTRDLDRFKDAYHFNSKTSKLMVGEISQLISGDKKTRALARKRRHDIICPLTSGDISFQASEDSLIVTEGKACRIWRKIDD